MKFKVFSEDKLQLLGQEVGGIFIRELMEEKILQQFVHTLSTLDKFEDYNEVIRFEKEFDTETDADYVFYHLVMFGTTLLKYNSTNYIMKKKFFGGYEEDLFKAFSFVKGLEAGLFHFRQKGILDKVYEIKADIKVHSIEYSHGEPLSKLPLPYFYYEHSNKNLNEISLDFASNLAYIRKPENPDIVIEVINEFTKDIVPIVHRILNYYFVE
jgi:hypothetical protein